MVQDIELMDFLKNTRVQIESFSAPICICSPDVLRKPLFVQIGLYSAPNRQSSLALQKSRMPQMPGGKPKVPSAGRRTGAIGCCQNQAKYR